MSEPFFLDENRPDGAPPRRPSLFAANALFLLAAAGLVVMSFLAEPLALFLHRRLPALSRDAILLATATLYYIPCLAVPALAYARRRDTWASMRFERPLAPSAALYAVLAAFVSLPLGVNVSLLWNLLLQRLGLTLTGAGALAPATPQGLAIAVFYLGVMPGICEELAFRGLVLGAWERRGSLRALVISSLLFASLHGSVSGFPTQLLLGLVIGALALGSGSIYAGMIFHTLYNCLILFAQYIAQNLLRYSEAELAEALLAETDILAYLGGVPGVLQTCLDLLLLAAVMLFVLHRVWRRRARAGIELVPRTAAGMTAQETLVLISAVVTVLYLYGTDLLKMLGGMR